MDRGVGGGRDVRGEMGGDGAGQRRRRGRGKRKRTGRGGACEGKWEEGEKGRRREMGDRGRDTGHGTRDTGYGIRETVGWRGRSDAGRMVAARPDGSP
jgi:hypothetical protein